MLGLSPKELKVIAKIRSIKGYKSMYEDELLSALKESERNSDKTRTKEIKKSLMT